MSLPWYKDGLHFKCTGCGRCCSGEPGAIWITEEELLSLAQRVQLTPEEFRNTYVRQLGNRLSLKEVKRGKNYDCIFLKGKLCQVYDMRPKQCRAFPWWPQNLSSKTAWDHTAKECEGIDHPEASLISQEEIDSG